jgi:HNH endonuclease
MIGDRTRQLVRKRAKYRCEYCHSLEEASATQFTIDHLVPRSLGGSNESDNLALACQRCNGHRYNFTTGIDPQSQTVVPLFNPRQQEWSDHFCWTQDGLEIVGLSSVGRATCDRLDLNDARQNDGFIRTARSFWVKGGWHPPVDDPKSTHG